MKKIFSILVVAVVAFAFTSCGGSDTPEKVAEKFLNHVAKNEFKDAKALATDDAAKTIETLESLSSMGGDDKKELKDVKIEDMKCETKEDVSNCTYKKDGKEGTIDLTKVDGKWKVSNYPKEMGGDEGFDAEADAEVTDSTATDDVTEEVAK